MGEVTLPIHYPITSYFFLSFDASRNYRVRLPTHFFTFIDLIWGPFNLTPNVDNAQVVEVVNGMGRLCTLTSPLSIRNAVDTLKKHLSIPFLQLALARNAKPGMSNSRCFLRLRSEFESTLFLNFRRPRKNDRIRSRLWRIAAQKRSLRFESYGRVFSSRYSRLDP